MGYGWTPGQIDDSCTICPTGYCRCALWEVQEWAGGDFDLDGYPEWAEGKDAAGNPMPVGYFRFLSPNAPTQREWWIEGEEHSAAGWACGPTPELTPLALMLVGVLAALAFYYHHGERKLAAMDV